MSINISVQSGSTRTPFRGTASTPTRRGRPLAPRQNGGPHRGRRVTGSAVPWRPPGTSCRGLRGRTGRARTQHHQQPGQGNYIGTDVAGTAARHQHVGHSDRRTRQHDGRLGGRCGTYLRQLRRRHRAVRNATANTIHGNRIGTAADGVAPLGKQPGNGNSRPQWQRHRVGERRQRDRIQHRPGISVTLGTQNAIRRNPISHNGDWHPSRNHGVTPNDASDPDRARTTCRTSRS